MHSPMNRRAFIAAASAASIAGCARPAPDRTLRVSFGAISEEVDPYIAPNFETAEVAWSYADGLTGDDLNDLSARSVCAKAPTANATFTAFSYELRDGIRWHDGKALDAHDVVACLARVQKSPWGSQRPFSLVERIDVVDPLRFTVRLTKSDPRFPLAFFTPFGSPGLPLIRPGHLPIGTGPFSITQRSPDLVVYRAWSSSPRGVPHVSNMRLQFVAGYQPAEVMLKTGESDLALYVPYQDALARGLPYIKKLNGVGYVILNTQGVLNTPQRRRAFMAAIDRATIVEKLYRGWSRVYDSVVAPAIPGSSIPLAPAFDTTLARSALAHLDNIDIAAVSGTAEKVGLLVQSQLARAGVHTSIQLASGQTWLAPSGPLRSGRFDVALFGEFFSLDPDLEASWGCAASSPVGGNFARFCDPTFDRAATAGDFPKALGILAAESVVMPLTLSYGCMALGRRIRGAANPPDLVSPLFQCAQWSVG
jgi:peptide/nickel transport system substrate-binding protein